MKLTWKGKYRNGEIVIEAETLEDLNNFLDRLFSLSGSQMMPEVINEEFPTLPSQLGCSDAIRTLLQTEWGEQPRSMVEIRKALEANALYFSKGTLSGTLTLMTQSGHLRRFKKAGSWVYSAR